MQMLQERLASKAPHAEAIARAVEQSLSGPEQAISRLMLACLLEKLSGHSV